MEEAEHTPMKKKISLFIYYIYCAARDLMGSNRLLPHYFLYFPNFPITSPQTHCAAIDVIRKFPSYCLSPSPARLPQFSAAE